MHPKIKPTFIGPNAFFTFVLIVAPAGLWFLLILEDAFEKNKALKGKLENYRIVEELTDDSLVTVKILEKCREKDEDGELATWYLIETPDKQRSYLKYYRGPVGDSFRMVAKDIEDFHYGQRTQRFIKLEKDTKGDE